MDSVCPVPLSLAVTRGTPGTETSQYREEKKTNVIPLVTASERGKAQSVNPAVVMTVHYNLFGDHGVLRRCTFRSHFVKHAFCVDVSSLERDVIEGENPVCFIDQVCAFL